MPKVNAEINHPACTACGVPMWLVRVELGDIADHQHFECKVCDRKIARTMHVDAMRSPDQPQKRL